MKKKRLTNILLVILGILNIIEIGARIIIIQTNTFAGVVQMISLLFAVLYVFWLYKKPHGNILKYAMLIFAIANILSSSYLLLAGRTYQMAKLLAVAAVCYCAGRLNRIDQNKYIMPIIAIVLIGVSICGVYYNVINQTANVFTVLTSFNNTINYITLMIAYFVRYEEHKEAGIMDAPKN